MTDSSITVICSATASTGLATVAVVGDQVWMALIAAVSAAVVAIPTIVIALKGTNKKIDDTKLKIEEKAVESREKLEKVSDQLDGRLSKLIEAVSIAKLAEGRLEGLKEGAQIASAAKLTDALIAATPKSAAPEPATIPIPAEEPSKSEVGI